MSVSASLRRFREIEKTQARALDDRQLAGRNAQRGRSSSSCGSAPLVRLLCILALRGMKA